MTTAPRYRWANAHEWLKDAVSRDFVRMDLILSAYLTLADSDDIQDEFQSWMDDDGYFDKLYDDPCPVCLERVAVDAGRPCIGCNHPTHEDCGTADQTSLVCNLCEEEDDDED